jgi:hypothetical protein
MHSTHAKKNRASQRLLIINTLTTTLVLLILALEATEGRPQQQQPQKLGPQKQHQLRRNIDNCWALVDETYWPRIINFDQATSTIRIFIQQTGPRVLRCLQDQGMKLSVSYKMTLTRSWGNETQALGNKIQSVQKWLRAENGYDLATAVPAFNYILLRGIYRVTFDICDMDPELEDYGCEFESPRSVVSAPIPVNASHPGVDNSWCLIDEILAAEKRPSQQPRRLEKYAPVVKANYVNFSFAFLPCHKVLPYEQAVVSVFQSDENNTVCQTGLEILKTNVAVENSKIVNVRRNQDESPFESPEKQARYETEAVIAYQTPELENDRFYCIRITSTHPFCQSLKPTPFLSDPGSARIALPEFCNFTSATVYIANLPFITEWVPFCTSHFKCGWLYITVVGTATLLLSFLCALIFNFGCCRRRNPQNSRSKQLANELNVSPSNLDTLKLTDIRPKRTWLDVHEEFYREPPANPGKILLLYSPDSKQFKELQVAFRSFLELACHCVVLDLFDEELLQAIAYDPEAWIDQLLRDDRFKVIVVCSQGAYKRHQAILNGEVLNIPNTDSLDGLFSAGLRFLQARQYDKGRLSLARYEMLHLSSADFRFEELGADREFDVPTQLHELFCWIHDHDPLDLLGKPWARYHLELQLLQDSLKKARMDRSS